MKIYLITLCGAVLLAYCAECHPLRQRELRRERLSSMWVMILMAFLIIISGLRYMNYDQSDENNYRYMVDSTMGQDFDRSEFGWNKEWLFYVLVWVSANVFNDSQALIFISALITNVLIVWFFAKYARPFWFAIFLYIAGGAFSSSMNVLRQYLAVAIILWCYPLAQQRRLILYCALVAIAAWLHQSAWIMLLAYPILRRKNFDFWTILIVVGAYFVFANFETVMAAVLPSTSYDHYLEDIIKGKYGVKWIRIAAWLVPYVIIIVFYRRFHLNCGIGYDVLYGVLLSACISIVSSRYVFAARIETYFSLITYMAIARIPELFVKRDEGFIRGMIVALFFAFGLYQYSISPDYHNILF